MHKCHTFQQMKGGDDKKKVINELTGEARCCAKEPGCTVEGTRDGGKRKMRASIWEDKAEKEGGKHRSQGV